MRCITIKMGCRNGKFGCVSRLRPIMIAMLTTVLGLMSLILSNDATCHGMALRWPLVWLPIQL